MENVQSTDIYLKRVVVFQKFYEIYESSDIFIMDISEPTFIRS